MLRFFIVLSFQIIFLFAEGQPVFNTLNVPSIGTSITFHGVNNNTVDEGSAGANQVWDFSSLTFSYTVNYQMVDPSSTACSSLFPDANRAEGSSGVYRYYIIDSNTSSFLGENGVDTIIYSNPLTDIQYPATYNSITKDTALANYNDNGSPVVEMEIISTQYDGYGTLKTANGTFSNVGRFKSVTIQKFFTHGITDYDTTISYIYTLPGNYYPLFKINEFRTGSVSKFAFLYDTPSLTATTKCNTLEMNISVGPNPVKEFVKIYFKDQEEGNYELAIINDVGEKVIHDFFFASSGSVYTSNLSGLQPGLYFLTIKSDKGVVNKKIIKN